MIRMIKRGMFDLDGNHLIAMISLKYRLTFEYLIKICNK